LPSTATFWSLMDRWNIPDDQALELIAYDGKLPDSGKRPRFRLSHDQSEIVSSLLEIDFALDVTGLTPDWLSEPMPDTDRTPLDLMRAGAVDEFLDLLRKISFEASLRAR
jgi:hypothetical protein